MPGTSAALADFATDGKIGVDLTKTYLSASAGIAVPWPAKPGDIVHTTNGGRYIFARAESEVSAGMVVIFSTFGDSAAAGVIVPPHCTPITTTMVTTTVGPNAVGVSVQNIPSANWGWIALNGFNLQINAAAGAQPKLPLFTTSTAGQLNTTTVSSCLVSGIVLNTSATSASFPLAFVNNPHIQWGNPV